MATKILSDLPDNPSKWKFGNEKISCSLVSSDFTKSKGTRSVSGRFRSSNSSFARGFW
eukprot:CAMPEP_0117051618 /NCGR_PEP_ID=MMETSP0472-20121206/35661_1 /TAXON_ID=693140 ORGANISM="Tiarina fusus, Strain LIS" /NCGR_SAMPLE_ID=MMETSP0472 /ASSEMBLY_ACC=CAM_ASM_000603 /LENGTH=57 /DNA_ID=CAMNT_0004765893 /DNA_START=204 /DNA_END=377 /DNA_ORIENTATION=-